MLEEFAGVDTGDARRNRRVLRVVERMAQRPTESFPSMFDAAELQALYRLLGNDEVMPEVLMAPHYEATVRRAQGRDDLLAIHDSTYIVHGQGGPARDFYDLSGQKHGYICHTSLIATRERLPLGVGQVCFVERDPNRARTAAARAAREASEQARWWQGVQAVEERFGALRPVHVMDSEADDYALLGPLQQHGYRFVIRAAYDRIVQFLVNDRPWEGELLERMRQAPVQLQREVSLSERTAKDSTSKRNGPRTARTALLEVRARTVTLKRPEAHRHSELPAQLTINVVLAEEVDPPAGETAVQWVLLTSENIDTVEQIEAVIDQYRARWLIEELFKAIKTGCALEKRQLEYQHTSQNALALSLPLAWRMLLLRALDRGHSQAPAAPLLGELLPLLRLLASKPLPPSPTVADAMKAIAQLGGHIKANGPPGWLVLARGLTRLQEAWFVAGRLAQAQPQPPRCDG
jgi:hypothetical protein